MVGLVNYTGRSRYFSGAAPVSGTYDGLTPTRYVSGTATGTGDGLSEGNPWTIDQAITSGAGQIIGVLPGTVTRSIAPTSTVTAINLPSGTSSNPTIFVGKYNPNVEVSTANWTYMSNGVTSGNNGCPTFGSVSRNWVQWRNLVLDETNARPRIGDGNGTGPILFSDANNFMARNIRVLCQFIDNSGDNLSGIQIRESGSTGGGLLENIYVQNRRPTASSQAVNCAAVTHFSTKNITVRNCYFYNCSTGNYHKEDNSGTGLGGVITQYCIFDTIENAIRVHDANSPAMSGFGNPPNQVTQNLFLNCTNALEFRFGGFTTSPSYFQVINNTCINTTQFIYLNFQQTSGLNNCLIRNNLIDASTNVFYIEDSNTAAQGYVTNGFACSYNSQRGSTRYGRTSSGNQTTAANFNTATNMAPNSTDIGGATSAVFINNTGLATGNYRLVPSTSPARNLSNTGGPIGCYITGTETIGLGT